MSFPIHQFGNNLNRLYKNPDITKHPAIFANKTLIDHYASSNRLDMFLDLHAHSSMRGCCMYGNVTGRLEDQVENQLYCKLISLNTPHFDNVACIFSKDHMSRVERRDNGLSAEGSGRVYAYLQHGVVHSYTLECSYHSSRLGNEVAAAGGPTGGLTADLPESSPFTLTPSVYSPTSYQGVGRACVVAMSDLRDCNPCSRLPNSKYRDLPRARNSVLKEIESSDIGSEYFMSPMEEEDPTDPGEEEEYVIGRYKLVNIGGVMTYAKAGDEEGGEGVVCST